MRWYLNPLRIRRTIGDLRRIHEGGGPRSVALHGFSEPKGWLVPHTVADLTVAAKDGRVTRFEPELPLPLPVAYGYRVGNALDAPLVAGFDPGRLKLRIKLPI